MSTSNSTELFDKLRITEEALKARKLQGEKIFYLLIDKCTSTARRNLSCCFQERASDITSF
jgi:hypothetical protein